MRGPTYRRLGLLLLAAACQRHPTETRSGLTGVDLTVTYPAKAALDRMTITGTFDGVTPAFAPATVPDPRRPLAPTAESVVLLLPDEFDGQGLVVRVDGLHGADVAASGQGWVELQARSLVPLTVALGAPAVCGDGAVREGFEACDDGNLAAGDGCSPSCSVEPGFMCDSPPGGTSTCAAVGTVCPLCDPQLADNCTVGACACGTTGASCGPGQYCSQGACLCDGSSCPGCCDSLGLCRAAPVAEACGSAGLACEPCPAGAACNEGVCAGCNSRSCPDGCCSGRTCVRPTSAVACGVAGAACQACAAGAADGCGADGTCSCGGGAPCDAGSWCGDGRCVCDGSTCAGCCDPSGSCWSGGDDAACGAGGVPCQACGGGVHCQDGSCR